VSILLANVGVDADGAEERLHPEGARFVGDDRDDQVADLLVAEQLGQDPDEDHRGRGLAPFGALGEFLEQRVEPDLERFDADRAPRHGAAQRLAALADVLQLGAVLGRTVERRVGDLLV
jgi:hypothetical protein